VRWFVWRSRRDEQWVDKYGRVWFCKDGKWWRNGLSIHGLLTFQPVRVPPRDCEPYAIAETKIRTARITDLCPETARLSEGLK
jgi:hypothetical protein